MPGTNVIIKGGMVDRMGTLTSYLGRLIVLSELSAEGEAFDPDIEGQEKQRLKVFQGELDRLIDWIEKSGMLDS